MFGWNSSKRDKKAAEAAAAAAHAQRFTLRNLRRLHLEVG
jgi:hypothetical protein